LPTSAKRSGGNEVSDIQDTVIQIFNEWFLKQHGMLPDQAIRRVAELEERLTEKDKRIAELEGQVAELKRKPAYHNVEEFYKDDPEEVTK
jgi:hypothetical protein